MSASIRKFNPYFLLLSIVTMTSLVHSKPVIQRIRAVGDTVGLYEKFEARIVLDAVYQNPFDPAEIEIAATFISPSGKKWSIPGFYNYNYAGSLWMVRFSPQETGQWTYQVNARDVQGKAVSEPDTFAVVPSKHHGPVRVSSTNSRYLEYADGTPFYGVGLWYNDGYQRFDEGQIKTEILDQFRELGINFISSYMTPLETMGSGVGRYDQNLCGRLDQVMEWCEARDMLLSLNIWFHSYLSETVWPGGNRRWQTNPYQTVCKAKDFYSSKEAWLYQEKLYRYIIARWSYSRALAIWFVVDEVNGTDGWASGDSLGAAVWAKKVHDSIKASDPYGHLTTGTRSGGFFEFWHEGYQTFDLAAREIYEAQGFPILRDGKIDEGDAHPLRLSYMNYAGEIKKLWNGYNKPAIIGETGWDHTFYEPSMPGYLAQYHNVLWAGLSSGLAMTPFWWAYSPMINDNVITRQLTSFSRFVSHIPFSKLTHVSPVPATLSNGDAFAIKSDQLTFGWVVNPVTDVTGAVVTVASLAEGNYTLQIYHTWRGDFIYKETVSSTNGSVTFNIPVLKIKDGHAEYVGQDIAFILQPVE
jgi:hypothetical protein